MKIHLDLHSGIAGDMLLGAMIDAGLSLTALEKAVRKAIRLPGWRLESRPVERQGWPGRSFRVLGDRPFGSADKMMRTVRVSGLPKPVVQRSLAVFCALAAS
jgi:pyridinium-3,5-bisthiocarboxylic acid mononucleotide nickel chelatase